MWGVLSLICLVLIYFRSWLRRWAKRKNDFATRTFWVKTLAWLNKYHGWLGGLATIFIIIHCATKPTMMENPVLYLLLIFLIVFSLLGLVMELKFLPEKWRHLSHRYHAKWWSGIIILALFLLGHLLI